MLAQFKDKKLPTTDFKMNVNGKVLYSVSESGKCSAIFKVKSEKKVFDVFKSMMGISEMPKPSIKPKGIMYIHTMEDGTKVALRNFAESETGAQWTLDFAKVAQVKANKLDIKFIYDK